MTSSAFYDMQRAGNFASTSQINPSVYQSHFEPCLRDGCDVLYLCFSSGLSSTIESANICMTELQGQYPDRTILCIDTLCASVGEGFLVLEVARKQAEGYSMEAPADWVQANRLRVCHWFTVDTFDHLKHGNRVVPHLPQ